MSEKEVHDRGFWWHWQNLKKDNPKAWLHGRAWLHQRPRGEIGVEWVFPSRSFHIGVTIGGDENQFAVAFAIFLFAFYFHLHGWAWLDRWKVAKSSTGRVTRLALRDWAIWWNLWTEEHVWHSTTPKWRDGCFHIGDCFLGKYTHSKVEQTPIPVLISMPEKDYEGTLTFFTQTWKRSRSPFLRQQRGASIDVEGGIPVPGKGENSWDCDDSAFMSIGTSETTIVGAIDAAICSVNERRERYGGKGWLPQEVQHE